MKTGNEHLVTFTYYSHQLDWIIHLEVFSCRKVPSNDLCLHLSFSLLHGSVLFLSGQIFLGPSSLSMIHNLHTTMPRFPHRAVAVDSTRRKFPQKSQLVAMRLLKSLMNWTFLVQEDLERCTAQCTLSLPRLLRPVVLFRASLRLSLGSLGIHFEVYHSPSLSSILQSSVVTVSLTLLALKTKIKWGRRDHWFLGTSHRGGMSSCSVGALISGGEWPLLLSRTFNW